MYTNNELIQLLNGDGILEVKCSILNKDNWKRTKKKKNHFDFSFNQQKIVFILFSRLFQYF